MVRENLKESKERMRYLAPVSVYLVPVADHLTVSVSWTIDSYADQANGGTLHLKMHCYLHQTE